MRSTWRHLLRRQHRLPGLWLLLLLSANALQVVAATHWHSAAISIAASTGSAPHAPAPDGDHDGCLLCQVAAHAGAAAPPPAPWALYTLVESHAASLRAIRPAALLILASHAWQGRAPPLI